VTIVKRNTDYAIRALAYMATERGRKVTARNLAVVTAVTEPSMAKTLRLLAKAGLIEGKRGRLGGYVLKKQPAEITLGSLISVLQEPFALNRCVVPQPSASDKRCPLRPAWKRIQGELVDVLDSVTLQDMLDDRGLERDLALLRWHGLAIEGDTGLSP